MFRPPCSLKLLADKLLADKILVDRWRGAARTRALYPVQGSCNSALSVRHRLGAKGHDQPTRLAALSCDNPVNHIW